MKQILFFIKINIIDFGYKLMYTFDELKLCSFGWKFPVDLHLKSGVFNLGAVDFGCGLGCKWLLNDSCTK